MEKERTLVLIKPDGVKKGLIGKILGRFEDAGLKIVEMKMVLADEVLAMNHYFIDEDWCKSVYSKTVKAYEKDGKKVDFKTPKEIGERIQGWNMKFLQEGPVIALVLEGPHAVELVRKMVGATEPRASAPGTIRGDFASIESYPVADANKRVLRNLVHASDSVDNAKREIGLWFEDSKMHEYKKVHELIE